MINFYDKIKG
jgi:hypothetical protein